MTIPDMPLPPWLRKIQQTWAWQVVGLPILVGFGGFLLAQGCLAHGIFNIDKICLEDATSATIVSFLTVLISGHSTDSASFNPDGTKNQLVAQVVATDAATVAVKEAIKVNTDAAEKK